MTKYKAPPGGGGISVGGQYLPADENGIVTTPDDGDYTILTAHDYVQVPDDLTQPEPSPDAGPTIESAPNIGPAEIEPQPEDADESEAAKSK